MTALAAGREGSACRTRRRQRSAAHAQHRTPPSCASHRTTLGARAATTWTRSTAHPPPHSYLCPARRCTLASGCAVQGEGGDHLGLRRRVMEFIEERRDEYALFM